MRRTGQRLAPWEITLIEDVDDLYLAAQREQPGPGDGNVKSVAGADDIAGVRSILSSVAKRRVKSSD